MRATYSDLLRAVATEANTPMTTAERVLKALAKTVAERAQNNIDSPITHFGTFKVRLREARNGINPSSGEKIIIEARRAISFKPSAKLKQKVNS